MLPSIYENRITTDKLFKVFGYKEHRNIKELISSHIDSFSYFGEVRLISVGRGPSGGRPLEVYAINLEQALFLCGMVKNSSSSNKTKILRELIGAYSKSSLLSILNLISSMDVSELDPERFVYVARESISGRYKIGISKDPERRVKELNIGNPEELELVHFYKATESGYKSESLAHALFEKERLRSEWFDSSIDISLLPSYKATCTASSGDFDCDCIKCSQYEEAFDVLDGHDAQTRDFFVAKLIKDTGMSFEDSARCVDALYDTGAIEIKQEGEK